MKGLLVLFVLAAMPLRAFDMTEDTRRKILGDEIVASAIEDSGGVGIEATYMIRKPLGLVWAKLQDFDFYRKVYKEYLSISVASENAEGMIVDYVMDVGLKKVKYSLRRSYPEQFSFRWTLEKGDDFLRLDGEYRLMSTEDDDTILLYRSFIRPKSDVANFFKNMFAVRQTKKAVLKLKKAIEGPGGADQ